MTPVEVLRIAITKETDAVEFYRAMSMQYPEIRELLLFLMNEEEKHRQVIEKRMSEITLH